MWYTYVVDWWLNGNGNCSDKIDRKTFKHHVNNKKNDFSDWINHVFNEEKLSDELREIKSIEETKNKILEYVN